jgi:hypothetical protein
LRCALIDAERANEAHHAQDVAFALEEALDDLTALFPLLENEQTRALETGRVNPSHERRVQRAIRLRQVTLFE